MKKSRKAVLFNISQQIGYPDCSAVSSGYRKQQLSLVFVDFSHNVVVNTIFQ